MQKEIALQLYETEDEAGIPQLIIFAGYKCDDVNDEFLLFDQQSQRTFSGC